MKSSKRLPRSVTGKRSRHLLQLLHARPLLQANSRTPGKPASGSKQLNGMERARSLRVFGLPRQAMPILKPAIAAQLSVASARPSPGSAKR